MGFILSWQAQYLVRSGGCCLSFPRIVNSVSCVKRIQHEIHFSWQAQYLVSWRVLPVAPRSVNSVACVKRIQHEIHVSWQAQYFVRLEDDTSCSAHYK